MKANFEITDNHALTFEGRHIDLHNNFEFVGFEYNVADREIKLNWKKSNGDWVDKNEFSTLLLTHKEVTFLKVINQEEKSTYVEDSCLGDITFFPSTVRELNDRTILRSTPNEDDDILYLFENGQLIRIHCEEAELKVSKEQILNITFTKDEALVAFEFVSRLNETEQGGLFEDQAEQKILWLIEGQFQKKLVEPFVSNYKETIANARKNIRDET